MRFFSKWLADFQLTNPQHNDQFYFDALTGLWRNKRGVSMFLGSATTGSGGVWQLAFPAGQFINPPQVWANARAVSEDRADRYQAAIISVSTVLVSGVCSGAQSTSLLGLGTTLINAPAGVEIDIFALGS